MLLSEAEAKTKECRVGIAAPMNPPIPWNSPSIGGNSLVPEPIFHRCSASACMHWRFGEPVYEYEKGDGKPTGDGWEPTGAHDYGTGTTTSRWRRVTTKRGYCGLAGHP